MALKWSRDFDVGTMCEYRAGGFLIQAWLQQGLYTASYKGRLIGKASTLEDAKALAARHAKSYWLAKHDKENDLNR